MVRVARTFLLVIRLAAPIVFRAFLFTAGVIATTVTSIWVGIPTAVSRIANEWLDRAVIAGFHTQWDRQFYYVLWLMAFLTVIAGWVLLSFITVWIVNLIF